MFSDFILQKVTELKININLIFVRSIVFKEALNECKNIKPEDHWSCIAHLSAEDMLKPAVIEEQKFKHSSWAGADNPLGPKF